jgi:PEP-CTERM motif
MFQTLRRVVRHCRLIVSPVVGASRHDIRPAFIAAASLLSIVGALLLTTRATANFIIYPGNGMGNTVTYSFDDGVGNLSTGGVPGIVRETSIVPTHPAPLFGPPTISGDSMDFNPAGFGVFAQNGLMDFSDGQLTFMVSAKPGQAVKNIKFKEAGVVTLVGLGGLGTKASDSLPVHIDIVEIDGVPVTKIPLDTGNGTLPPTAFSPKGSFNMATDGALNAAPWSGSLFADLDQVLINKGIHFTRGVTKISVNLDNQLLAMSQSGTTAFMDKKDFFTVTSNSPEPASCVLALMGVAGIGFFVRRRSS